MALVMTTYGSRAHADPADIFQIGAPAIGSEPPKAASISDGDVSVSSQTGALQYGYSIHVPPGRRGMQPHLALSYSSQAPIYGGLAAGWSLNIPIITEDTTLGRLWRQGTSATKVYKSSMTGDRPLVAVTEWASDGAAQQYRAQDDATFTRYELLPAGSAYLWKALTTDGVAHYFGDSDHFSGGAGACSFVSDGYAPLTREVDPFGNEVNYYYTGGVDSGECRIDHITWGLNAGAGVSDFASATFLYSTASQPLGACNDGIPIGSQSSYRTGDRIMTGASELDQINVYAYPPGGDPSAAVHTRVVTLAYDRAPNVSTQGASCPTCVGNGSCSGSHAPFRALASIQESAWGTDSPRVDLPAVTFSYGDANIVYPSPPPDYTPSCLWPFQSGVPFNMRCNLGWGYRFPEGPKPPTVEAMLLDVDGDGLLDRVHSSPASIGGTTYCQASWFKNLGGGTFSTTARTITLPTLKWAGGSSPTTTGGDDEACALNYQDSNYLNFPSGWGADVNGTHCPAAGGLCPTFESANGSGWCDGALDYGTDVFRPTGPVTSPSRTLLSYRWMDVNGDGLTDLVASPSYGGLYNLQVNWNGGLPIPEPPIFGAWPACPVPSAPSTNVYSNGAYTMCGGMYPWMIYLNHGNGVFGQPPSSGASPTPDRIAYQPVPLETTSGDSSITARPLGVNEGITDIDGDGYPDGIITSSVSNSCAVTNPNQWSIYRNGGTGFLLPLPGSGNGFSFPAAPTDILSCSAYNTATNDAAETDGILDINGDGLPDHWTAGSNLCQNNNASLPNSASIELNDGTRFRTPAELSLNVRPGNEGVLQALTASTPVCKPRLRGDCTFQILAGTRTDVSRVLDVDADGRVDVVGILQNDPTNASVAFNDGGQFQSGSGASVPYLPFGAAHWIVASDQNFPASNTWELRSDMTDLDGDGLLDEIDFDNPIRNPGHARVGYGSTGTPGQPPRLLATIDNGRGAITTVAYASSTNAAVVQQTPGQDGDNRTMPHAQWVVRSTSVADSIANTTTTTSHVYRNPRVTQDPDTLHYAFRGFDEVDSTLPSGAMRVERYDYSVDWSGRLKTTLMVPVESEWTIGEVFCSEAAGCPEVRSIDETTWEPRMLMLDSGTVTSFHATIKDHWTCRNGQTEEDCRGNTDTRTRTVATLAPISDWRSRVFRPWLYAVTSERVQAAPTQADGDRESDIQPMLLADGSSYRLNTLAVTKSQQVAGSLVMYAKTAHVFDPSSIVPVTDEVWTDNVDAHRLITKRQIDPGTGNVLQRWKPQQNPDAGGDGNATSYTYDARKLFAVTELSEPAGASNLRQERDYTWEYGTGTKLETIGPNAAFCSTSAQGCPTFASAQELPREDHRIRIDGIGRTIERDEGFMSYGGPGYIPVKVEVDSYVDGPSSSSTHQGAIDGALNGQPVRYTKDTTLLDGHGRPIQRTTYSQGAAPADQVTTYHYNPDGTLGSVSLPDPTANDASTVTYTYTFDSLGRPTRIRRPDDVSPLNQSGVNMSYDGLSTTSAEVVGSSGGNAAATQTLKDAFGRVVAVYEQFSTSASAWTWVATQYTYTPDDNVSTVTDPESNVTTLVHDFAGRRTQILRPNDRTWTYAYDANGNVISETVPGGTSATDARFITTIAYDDLDRPTSKLLGSRGLSAADAAYFGADHEVLSYDSGENDSGRLASWGSYAPAASKPTTFFVPTYDAQGRQQQTYHYTAGVAGSGALHRVVNRNYRIDGSPGGLYASDVVGAGTASSYVEQKADARGLPLQVSVSAGSSPTFYIGDTRNVAGLVTKQAPRGGSTSWPAIESDWSYDKLGRVASQRILQNNGTTTVVRQDLAYNGNDDPRQLDHYLGDSNHKVFQFGFDLRHQLTGVNETTTGGSYFNAGYDYGPAGRLASVVEKSSLPPNTTVNPRDVSYQFATGPGADPDEVVALSGTGATATFAYDAAGNQTMRCAGGTIVSGACTGPGAVETDYLYDGKDQLRRATKLSGGLVQGSEEYWYDGNGKRMIIVKRDSNGQLTEMVWFIDEVEAHYDASFNVTHVYTHIVLGGAVARIDRVADRTTNIEYLYHGLGDSTLAAVDQLTGAINASFSYAPFGEILEATDAGSSEGLTAHKRRLNDKYVDDISGLGYYGKRFYDGLSLTWTQGDPSYRFRPERSMFEPRRARLYTFSNNNPLSYIDPDGLDIVSFITRKPFAVDRDENGKVRITFGAPDPLLATIVHMALAVHPVTRKIDDLQQAVIDGPPEELKGLPDLPGLSSLRGAIEKLNAAVGAAVKSLEDSSPQSGTGKDANHTGPSSKNEFMPSQGGDDPMFPREGDGFGYVPPSNDAAPSWRHPKREEGAACGFENPDRFIQIFREHYTDVAFGVWGLELNPEGPWATPEQQAAAAMPAHRSPVPGEQ
jgi:RHS repeat-associated protein